MIRIADRLLRTFFKDVYRPLKLRGRSSNTLRLYKNTFDNFERYLGHPASFDDLEDDVVAGFMAWHTDTQGNTPETANKEGGQILAQWRLAARKGYVSEWPDVDMMPCPERTPMAWLEPELEQLFDSADQEAGTLCGIRAALWWRVLLAVIFFTGERISAVRSITWDKVDMRTGWLFLPAESRKGKRKDKAFPIRQEMVDLLRMIRHPEREFVFPWPYKDRNYIYYKYKKILIRARLPTDRKSKFHRIRKSTASYYKRAGGDPTDLLDHADPRTTKKYLDPRICGDRHSADALFLPWGQSREN